MSSLFWLVPGTACDVRVIFSDPDGLLHGVRVTGTGSTCAETTVPVPYNSFYASPGGGGVNRGTTASDPT